MIFPLPECYAYQVYTVECADNLYYNISIIILCAIILYLVWIELGLNKK